jgi:hypothetical protein
MFPSRYKHLGFIIRNQEPFYLGSITTIRFILQEIINSFMINHVFDGCGLCYPSRRTDTHASAAMLWAYAALSAAMPKAYAAVLWMSWDAWNNAMLNGRVLNSTALWGRYGDHQCV